MQHFHFITKTAFTMKTNLLSIIVAGIAMSSLLILSASCYRNFYKVTENSASANIDSTLTTQKSKYFILRSGNNAFHMDNIVINQENKSLTCNLGQLPQEHALHLSAKKSSAIPYQKSKGESVVLREIHIYTLQDNEIKYGINYTLDFAKITKIDILEKDRGRTTLSTVLSTGGIVLFTAAVAAIIAGSSSDNNSQTPSQSSSSGSCPFVSAYDGDEFFTQGELFAGAVYQQLARHDYLPLNMKPVSNGKLQLKISNDQQEIQNTDLAELMIITHKRGVQIMTDANGKLFSVAKPEPPVTAISNGQNILNLLLQHNDDLVYAYNDTGSNAITHTIQLSFNRKPNTKDAKLILQLKNSTWMEYVFGKMTQGYGTYYPSFIKQQHGKSAEELQAWINKQQIPLTVTILTNKGWQTITGVTSIGPLSMRQILVPIDLSNITGNIVHVQLSSGFMFWEMDYAAIDFSKDEDYTVQKLLPAKAVDENGKDVTALLSAADEKYLVQPVAGNITTVEYAYDNTTDKNKTQTYVLHAKGYYEYVRDYKNKPDINFLQQFKNPGALSAYSMALYKQFENGDLSKMAKQ